MSDGFLQGIDGAARLMSIYHGVRDREDKRKSDQLERDYRLSRDTVKDTQWQKNFEQSDSQFKQNKEYQYASLAQSDKHHKMNYGLSASRLKFDLEQYKEKKVKESAQQEADMRILFAGFDGSDSGISAYNIKQIPGAISGSFGEEGNNLAKQIGITSTPEGAPANGTYGAIDDGNGNILVAYAAKTPDGQKHITTVGEPIPKNDVRGYLQQAGNLGGTALSKVLGGSPESHNLAAGVDTAKIEQLRVQHAQFMAPGGGYEQMKRSKGQEAADNVAKALSDSITAEVQNVSQTRERIVSDYENEVRDKQQAYEQRAAEIAQQHERKHNNTKSSQERLAELKALYPSASPAGRARIAQEVEAYKKLGLDTDLRGGGLLKAANRATDLEEAQNKGIDSAYQKQAEDNTTNTIRGRDYLSVKDVNDYANVTAAHVDKQYGSKSPFSGKSYDASRKVVGWVQDAYGGITHDMSKDQTFRSQVQSITNLMVTKGINDPAAAVALNQRYGNSPTDAQILEVRAAFDGLRELPGITAAHLQPAVKNYAIRLMQENGGELSELPDYVIAAYAAMTHQ